MGRQGLMDDAGYEPYIDEIAYEQGYKDALKDFSNWYKDANYRCYDISELMKEFNSRHERR